MVLDQPALPSSLCRPESHPVGSPPRDCAPGLMGTGQGAPQPWGPARRQYHSRGTYAAADRPAHAVTRFSSPKVPGMGNGPACQREPCPREPASWSHSDPSRGLQFNRVPGPRRTDTTQGPRITPAPAPGPGERGFISGTRLFLDVPATPQLVVVV